MCSQRKRTPGQRSRHLRTEPRRCPGRRRGEASKKNGARAFEEVRRKSENLKRQWPTLSVALWEIKENSIGFVEEVIG